MCNFDLNCIKCVIMWPALYQESTKLVPAPDERDQRRGVFRLHRVGRLRDGSDVRMPDLAARGRSEQMSGRTLHLPLRRLRSGGIPFWEMALTVMIISTNALSSSIRLLCVRVNCVQKVTLCNFFRVCNATCETSGAWLTNRTFTS